VDLTYREFGGFNFRSANLTLALLAGSNLQGVDFRDTRLYCELSGTNLTEADLRGADLTSPAELRVEGGAVLTSANLTRADLTGANLAEVRFGDTIFFDTNLRNVRGLDVCFHYSPSALDLLTLSKSGCLPLPFLRGCGIPEPLMSFVSTVFGVDVDPFYSCFISYSTKDQDFVSGLHLDLQERGVRCWFAPEDLRMGDPFRIRIDEAIRGHDKLLLILSERSIASAWVEDEVESAIELENREKKLVLFPIRLDNAVMDTSIAWAAKLRRTRHIGDFSRWHERGAYSKAFERLLRDLKAQHLPRNAP
jgi:hypothetical protein